MGKPNKKHSAPKRQAAPALFSNDGSVMAGSLFFACFFWFLWRQVDLRLLYHGGGAIQFFPVFHWGWDVFLDHLRFPGGMTSYVSALLSQLFYHSWAGALVLTGVAWMIFVCAGAFSRELAAPGWRWAGYFTALLLLALYAGYCHCLLAATNLLVGLGAACLLPVWKSAHGWLRFSGILALAALLYAVASGAVVVFVLLAGAAEAHRGRWLLAAMTLLLAGLVPLAGGWWFYGLTQNRILLGLLPFRGEVEFVTRLEEGLFFGLCLVIPLSGWAMVLSRRMIHGLSGKAKAPPDHPAAPAGPTPWFWLVETGLVLVAALAVMFGFMNKPLKAVLAVDYYTSNRLWPEVLAASKGTPSNSFVLCAVNRALYHTGRLGYDLPLPQKPNDLVLPIGDPRAHWSTIDLCLDLGCVNMALHHASEAVGFYEARPYLVRRLALINLALGNTGTAEIYLRSLAKTPFHAEWANDYLRRLALDPNLSQDEGIQRMRQFKPIRDELVPMPAELMLLSALESGKDNRMAGEYLVVHYMLSRNLRALASLFQRLEAQGWKSLPPLYDEAAVLAARRVGVEPGQFKPAPSPEALSRHEKFVAAALAAGWNPEAPVERLPKQFANTYFYYFFSQL
jgi:hypothetical protein